MGILVRLGEEPVEFATDIDSLATRFTHCTLPKDEWTHHAHLRVGLWHLLRYPPAEALDLLRDRISRYNVSVGGVNTATDGYHETITRFYVWVIAQFVATADRSRSEDDLADELIRTRGGKDLPLRHWSRERLFSSDARLGWVEPDVRALE
jgi:hypothetical protein